SLECDGRTRLSESRRPGSTPGGDTGLERLGGPAIGPRLSNLGHTLADCRFGRHPPLQGTRRKSWRRGRSPTPNHDDKDPALSPPVLAQLEGAGLELRKARPFDGRASFLSPRQFSPRRSPTAAF